LAKGDQFTPEEIQTVKINLVTSAKQHGVEFFDVQSTIEDLPDRRERDLIIRECLQGHDLQPCPPFAIINPSHSLNQKVGRQYNWGFVDSLDPQNSDFRRLHKLVLRYMKSDLVSTMHRKYQKWDDKIRNAAYKSKRAEQRYQTYAIAGIAISIAGILGFTQLKK
jgi:septin family protein